MQVGRLKDAGSRIVKSFWWWGDDGDDDYLEDIAEQVRLRVDACPGAPSSAGVKHEEYLTVAKAEYICRTAMYTLCCR